MLDMIGDGYQEIVSWRDLRDRLEAAQTEAGEPAGTSVGTD